jgi:hypothetical protein
VFAAFSLHRGSPDLDPGRRTPHFRGGSFPSPAWNCAMLLACLGHFVDEQRPHTPLEVVAHLPCCLTTSGGSMLLTCRFDPHSQRVRRCAIWMARKPRHTAHRALSQAWVLNGCFGFPLWYKQRGFRAACHRTNCSICSFDLW